ncbi:ABC transporter substrate-binding protein [Alistipes sp.]|uniref:ABC transporter substrate-binding protein n=1 Tax=Alistipes sp. TaxID=1872444 RepID=UPI003AF11A49
MKRFPELAICLVMLLAAACGPAATRSAADFTRPVYTPAYATGFDIRGADDEQSTLLTVRNAWQGAGDEEQHLLLLRDGERAAAGFDAQTVKTPVHRVVCMSSSHVALFDAIGQIRRVTGVSGIDYISNPYVNAHRHCGEVREVGYDTNLDFELLAAMRPDVVLLYGVTGESGVVTGKLRELGIPYLYIGDYMEQSPLGKAEWLVLAAELCDCREAGIRVFEQIAERYNALRERIAADSAARPRVMINTPYRDTWFMPSSRSYMIRLIEDAGGEYVYAQNHGNSSVAVDLEEAYLLARDADVWINVGACNSLAELTAQNPKFARIPAVVNRRVWNNNRLRTPAGGSDFWESGAVRPDAVLRDLHALLYETGDSTLYYQRLR